MRRLPGRHAAACHAPPETLTSQMRCNTEVHNGRVNRAGRAWLRCARFPHATVHCHLPHASAKWTRVEWSLSIFTTPLLETNWCRKCHCFYPIGTDDATLPWTQRVLINQLRVNARSRVAPPV